MPDRLSAFDASLLFAEDTATPMHIGSVAVFVRPRTGFDYESLVDLVERRLALIPRYRQRVLEVPLQLARPVWVDDERFDITYHVRRSALPEPGSAEQLRELTGRLMSRPLDRERPLWEVYLVEGLAEDRLAIITKTHNALVDGIDAIEIGQAILDPGPREGAEARWSWSPRAAPSGPRLLLDALREALASPVELLDTARLAVGDLATSVRRCRDALGALTSALTRPAPGSPLNTTLGPHRRFVGGATELSAYRDIAERVGATVNDVVLAVVAGALRSWFTGRGEPLDQGSLVRALVPLSTNEDQDETVTPYLVDLPVGEPDPLGRLRQVRNQLRAHTESGHSVAARVLLHAHGLAPATLHALGSRTASGFTRHVFNLVITNVPGPQVPLYAAGARMVEMYPVVPLLRNQALAIGVSSYDGGVYFGLNADRAALADVGELAGLIETELGELHRWTAELESAELTN
ncbi:WS/DGAT/MGAT family O-acyltransferase [Sciscionella marina]|uniref:WS/DGAT/MGAT family O-acyltransferase n=1 Tax=Sciscionella marina TaxID=508770 RepID=UPI000381B3F4|nr:wax ester/triacylglycerol synthase family O-acyltransferase [Sciscionella marina]